MSADKDSLIRVQQGLYHLTKGLTPFVEQRMKARYGPNGMNYASRASGGSPTARLDAYGLLKTMVDQWRDVFDEAFPRAEKHRVRNFVSMAFEARNATAHLSLPLKDEEALRYLDAIHQLMIAVKAPASEIVELKSLYDQQRMSGVPASAEPSGGATAEAGRAAVGEPSASGLKPWIEVALPHPDVLANRFKEAEFAADLFAVDSGNATEDYATPESFFRITFLTEGLKRILTTALERLTKAGGDPVIGLQTAFGGGKTHTMLAVYHLARATNLSLLEGIGALADKVGVTDWTPPKVAVFVGTAAGPDTPLIASGGLRVHTLWGYIAWRIAGQAGLDLVAEAEAARTNPGSELLVDLFKLAGPSVILLDELVAYARQLPDERFEAFLSFIQSLTEAAKMAPGVLIIGSLPESKAEAGGERGEAALLRLEKVFGRVQSAWLPASGDETYEIIRRRLFQALDPDGEKAREAVIKAFHEMYRQNSAEFPPDAKEGRYLELLRLSYPIHPELFDRLSKDWASLPKFQRTRGVLRFMANVVGVLWHTRVSDPLITPARIPLAHERVRSSVLYPLDPAFGAVVDKEVDGDGSLPSRMEANPNRRISQAQAATRAARSVFLCSAPMVGQPNAGLNGLGLRLACAEPSDQLAIFGEALREFTERATYLYEEGGRYWFSTQPTLNRLAEDRAKALPDHEVDEAITNVLREEARAQSGFGGRVFPAPADPTSVDEAASLSLMILPPAFPHVGRGVTSSKAVDAVTDGLMRCRTGQRRYRNTLVYVAADEALLQTAQEAMRRSMAWAEILEDKRLQGTLTGAQAEDAKEKAKTSRDGAAKAVRLAWSHILLAAKSESTPAGQPFELEHAQLTARDRPGIPAAVYEKISPRGDGLVKEKLGPEAFWQIASRYWPEGQPHLAIAEVVEWFAAYPYMPKVRDRLVIEAAIQESAARFDPAFGYADAIQPDGTYIGLRWAKAPPEMLPSTAVLVSAEVAKLNAAPRDIAPSGGAGERPLSPPIPTGGGTGVTEPTGPMKPRRFYGVVEIDTSRPVRAFESILNAVVLELQRGSGTKVKLLLEVEAESPEGFDDQDVSVVRDNARQLKFKPESTGFE